MSESIDRVIYRAVFQQMLGVKSVTLRKWMKSGKIPKPDVAITARTLGWRLSTLQAAGIGVV